jgi:uncharacterized protein YjbI with pentapeptide repeats
MAKKPSKSDTVTGGAGLKPLSNPSEFKDVYVAQMPGRPLFAGYDFAGLTVHGLSLPAADFRNCSFTGARFIKTNCQGWVAVDCHGKADFIDSDTRFSAGIV